MTISTKYDIGDMVWFMHDNICVLKKVENINIDVCHMYIQYMFDGVDDFVKCAENSLKDYTVIKGDSWSAGKGHSHIIILENKENEKRDE